MNQSFDENLLEINSPAFDFPAAFGDVPDAPLNVGEKYLIFWLNENPYALAARQAAELTDALAVTRLPHAAEWLLGIAPLRGEIVPIISLKKLLAEKDFSFPAKSKFIVARFDKAAPVAFAVDRLGEIVAPPAEAVAPDAEKSAFVSGVFVNHSKSVRVIDLERICSSLAAAI